MNDNGLDIILQCDNSIDENKFIQVSFTAVANIPANKSIRNEKDLSFREIEELLKSTYGLSSVRINNARVITKVVKELEEK